MMKVRHLAPAILPALFLAGCGHNSLVNVPATQRATAMSAKAVTPDDPKTLADDLRRANYWAQKYGGSATLVMSIQTTAMNSQKLSAAANVFFCAEGFYASKPCVLVTRHYLTSFLNQDTEMADYNKQASKLQPIGQYSVLAPQAWTLAHGWQPVQPVPTCSANPCPASSAAPAGKQFFTTSRAFLIQGESNPVWSLYADNQKFVIDAVTGVVTPPTPQMNPNDPMNQGTEPDLQRACATWLPMSPFQANIQTDPASH